MNAPRQSVNDAHARLWRWPLFQGLLPIERNRLPPDIMAGITLAAPGIPEVMGYTKITGTPVVTGLYPMLLPILAFGISGSSRLLEVSTSATTGIDFSASRAIEELPQDLAAKGVVPGMSRMNTRYRGDFERPGLGEGISKEQILESRSACVAAYQTAFLKTSPKKESDLTGENISPAGAR